jgi:phage shock protein E
MISIIFKCEQYRCGFFDLKLTLHKKTMKNYFKTAITLIASIMTFQVVSAQTLSPEDFRKTMKKENGVLIDVRTPEEFQAERIRGAINIDVMAATFTSQIESLDKTRAYFLYCGIGKRSAKAAGIMKEAGFTKVYDLEKGLGEWKSKGFETQKPLPELIEN